MKSKIIGIVIVVVMVLVGLFLLSINSKKVEIEKDSKIVGIFNYKDNKVNVRFADENIDIIYEIFNGKKLYKDGLSCGFTGDVSIIIDDNLRFYFALDGDPYVYFENEDRFLTLTDDENTKLKEVLSRYGFYFPCV